jgi:hypothetical protein
MTGPGPEMYSRPTEVPEPLTPIQASREVSDLHTKWAALHGGNEELASRAHRKLLRAVRRILGRSDDVLIGDLIRAIDVLAIRCDELAHGVERVDTVVAEIAGTLGQDVARLQAQVMQLRSTDEDA